MDCTASRRLMNASGPDALTAMDRAALDAHLATCAHCARAGLTERRLEAALRQETVPPVPAALSGRILDQVQATPVPPLLQAPTILEILSGDGRERGKDRTVSINGFCPTCYWPSGTNMINCEWCRGFTGGLAVRHRNARARAAALVVCAILTFGAVRFWTPSGTSSVKSPVAASDSPQQPVASASVADAMPPASVVGYEMPWDYVMRPGDMFTLHIYGKIVDETYPVVVNIEGRIVIPRAGELAVAGCRYAELREVLWRELSKYLKSVQMSILMTRPAVYPTSEQARRPVVSALNCSDDFKLEIGSAFTIHVQGNVVDETYPVEVNTRGDVVLPRVGELKVLGMRRGDLNAFLDEHLRKYLKNVGVSTLMTRLR